MTTRPPLKLIPVSYVIAEAVGDDADITLHRMPQSDGSIKWAVRMRGHCLTRSGHTWELEPQPSSRSDEFLRRCRFPTKALAEEALQKWVNR